MDRFYLHLQSTKIQIATSRQRYKCPQALYLESDAVLCIIHMYTQAYGPNFYYRYSLKNFKNWYNFDWKFSILAGKNIYACVYTLCVRVRTWVHMCVRVCNTLLMRSEQLPKRFRENVAIATMPCLGMSGCTGTLQAHTLYQQSNLFADSPLASLLLASNTNNYAIMEAKYSKDFWNCLLYRTKWIPECLSLLTYIQCPASKNPQSKQV